MLIYKQEDILHSDADIIVHGQNCLNSMSGGIASQVASMYTEAMMVDLLTQKGDMSKLGNYTKWTGPSKVCDKDVTIVNAYTQYSYTKNEVDVDYDALRKVMERICQDFDNEIISMPKIGAGAASGDWKIIENILDEVSSEYGKVFHIYMNTVETPNGVRPVR